MNKTERLELSKILYGLASNFGDSLNEFGLELWVNAFTEDGITLPQIRKAAAQIIRTRKISKMPTYAEFIENIHGNTKDRAALQVDIVLDFLRYNGARAEPNFDDPVTQHLMTTRWKYTQWASNLREDETKWWIKEFVEAYQTYSRLGVNTMPQLEASQTLKKLADKIGNEEPDNKQPFNSVQKILEHIE